MISPLLSLGAADVVYGVTYASPPPVSTIEPSLSAIEAAAATATPLSPVSHVKGLAFDRFYQVWLENVVSLPREPVFITTLILWGH